MITSSEAARPGRTLRLTLVVSALLHLVLLAAGFHVFDAVNKWAVLQQKPKDEVVTISSAVTIDKRPKPVPVARPVPPHIRRIPVAVQRQAAPPQVARVPRPETLPTPQLPASAKIRHELAKSSALGTPEPKQTARAKVVADASASAAPRPPAVPRKGASRQVALAQQPAHTAARGQLSEAQLDQIERDLANTIAQARSANDPLRALPKETPAAPRHYRVQMEGTFGELRHGEGYYYPIHGWVSGGMDWYYVSYEFTYADGTYETGSVPWPIRFSPRSDPFQHPEIAALHHTPLPPPAADWQLTGEQAAHLGKALRPYFPNISFANN